MKVIIVLFVLALLIGGLFYSEYQAGLAIAQRDKLLERVSELEEKIEVEALIKEIIGNELNFPPDTDNRIERHLRNLRKVIEGMSNLFVNDKFVAHRYFENYRQCVNKLPAFSAAGEGECFSNFQKRLSLHN